MATAFLTGLEASFQPRARRLALGVAAAVAGAALLTLSAKTQAPFWPVPMTLQTLCVMAYAVLVGPRFATASFAVYLAAGAAGWPVFAGTPSQGIGLAYMAGPTGGYIAGNFLACAVVGWLARDGGVFGRSTPGRLAAMGVGLALIYALGVAWLARYVPAADLLAKGVAPFILGDMVKIALVAAAGPLVSKRLARLRSLG